MYLEERTNEMEQMRSQLHELEGSQQRLQEQESQITLLRHEIDRLNEVMTVHTKQKDDLKAQLTDQNKLIAGMNKDSENAKHQIQEAMLKYSQLQNEYQILKEKQESQLSAQSIPIIELKNQLDLNIKNYENLLAAY